MGKQLLNQEEDLIQVQHAVGKVTDFPVDMQAFCKYMKVLVLQRNNSAKLFSHNYCILWPIKIWKLKKRRSKMIKNKIEDHTRAREDDKSCTVATLSD